MKQKRKQTEMGKRGFIGTWHITKMSEWDNDYVNEEVKAFIKIEKSGENLVYDFTFDGSDECDPTNGDGWMKINLDGTAEGEIRFHMGDSSKFWAKRLTK